MPRTPALTLLLAGLLGACASNGAPSGPASSAAPNPATTPIPRNEEWWQARHAAMNARVRQGAVDLVFLGDSITQEWETTGTEVWARHYARRRAVNLGISGDQTEHVLWRLEHGNLEGIHPRVAVVLIGTNNVGNTGGTHTAEQIAAGVGTIVAELARRSPDTKVLLLAVFPRGEHPNPMRDTIDAINTRIARLADGERVRFLDLGPRFLDPDGTLPAAIMPDFLHLSPAGYEIWAQAIEPTLVAMLGEA